MKLKSRKLLEHDIAQTPSPPPGAPADAVAAAAADADAVRFQSSSVPMTALIFILALFFLGFFSVYARRIFSGVSRFHRSSSSSQGHHNRASHPSRGRLGSVFAPVHGLDASVVQALPVLCYVGAEGGGKEGCVVCLSEFKEKEQVKVIPRCGHPFHPECIDAWLVSRGSCPICRCSDMFVGSPSSMRLLFVTEPVEMEERRQDEAEAMMGEERQKEGEQSGSSS